MSLLVIASLAWYNACHVESNQQIALNKQQQRNDSEAISLKLSESSFSIKAIEKIVSNRMKSLDPRVKKTAN